MIDDLLIDPGVASQFDRLPPYDREAEMSLIASMMMSKDVAAQVRPMVTRDSFYQADHQIIFDVIVGMYERREAVDPLTVRVALQKRQLWDEVGGASYMAELLNTVPSSAHGVHYATVVREKYGLRRIVGASNEALRDCYAPQALDGDPVSTIAAKTIAELNLLAAGAVSDDVENLGTLLGHVREQLVAGGVPMVASGFKDLDSEINGIGLGEVWLVGARPSMGKAQPLDSKVLTTTGWTEMGKLAVGQRLASIDGKASEIVAVIPRGNRQVFRITLADGRSAECCEDHLWLVEYRDWENKRVLSTRQLIAMLAKARYKNRLYIETFGGHFGDDAGLEIHPWLLGALLGDGTIKGGKTVQFSTRDEELVNAISDVLPDGMCIKSTGGPCGYRIGKIIRNNFLPNELQKRLERIGLWGCGAETKFVPDSYKNSTKASRNALLAGLLDTDGWIEKFGVIRFCSCSRRLAEDVVYLVRSVGGSASYAEKKTTFTYKGTKCEGATSYVCNIQHPDPSELFLRVPKKQALAKHIRQRTRRLNIVSILPSRVTETQCIVVSHPSHLYITDGFMVTHNSTLMKQMLLRAAIAGTPALLISLEENKGKIGRNILAAECRIENRRMRKSAQLTEQDWSEIDAAILRLKDVPLFTTSRARKIEDIYNLASLYKNKEGVKLIGIDYMQLVEAGGKGSYEKATESSKGVARVIRDLNVAGIVPVQLNRTLEARDDKRPTMADIRDSGQIEQDADGIIFLHREDYYHTHDSGYEPTREAELIIAKMRDSERGATVRLRSRLNFQTFDDIDPRDDPKTQEQLDLIQLM